MDVEMRQPETNELEEMEFFKHFAAEIVDSASKLKDAILGFENLTWAQKQDWTKRLVKLAGMDVTVDTIAFSGQSGAGKSTLQNALLGEPILHTFSGSACTATVTEVHYKHKSDKIDAEIYFVSRQTWEEELNRLLRIIKDDDEDTEVLRSTLKRLKAMYPSVQEADLRSYKTTDLIKLDPIKSKLGKSLKFTDQDGEALAKQTRMYLAAGHAFWPIVDRAVISGDFSILRSGYTIIDLPGYGDDDEVRNAKAQEHLKKCSTVVLVVESQRAGTNPAVIKFLQNALSQQVLDARVGSLTIVVTKADEPVEEDEVELNDDEERMIKDFKAQLGIESRRRSRQAFEQPKKLPPEEENRILYEIQLILLAARNRRTRQELQDTYDSLCQQMKQDILPLRVFFVGSKDYLKLAYHRTRPGVFHRLDETGIPALTHHLLHERQVRLLGECKKRFTELSAASQSIFVYFSEGRHPGRLTPEIRTTAVACVNELEETIRELVINTFQAISQQLVELKAHLLQAVNDADASSLDAVKTFHDQIRHFSTLKATLMRQGVFGAHNLNRALTRNILPAIMADWNSVMNKKVPDLLSELKKAIQDKASAAEKRLVSVLQDKRIVFKELSAARQSLNLSGLLTGLVETSYGSITLAQREGTRSFAPIVQNQLREHYEEALTISGPGALKRMKECTVKFLENNSTQVFTAITQHLFQLLDDCISEAQKQFDEAASEIPTRLRLTLIDDLDLSPESRLAREDIVKVALDLRPRLQRMEMELEQMREGEPKAEPMD